MKLSFAAASLCILVFISSSFSQDAATPKAAEISAPGFPLIGYGLAFLLVGGAVYVSMYTSKRSNID